MKNYKAKSVEEYITSSPEEARPHLEELRKTITSTISKVEEKISWGIPFYRYHGALVGFATFKNHVSFGLAFAFQTKDREILGKKGYITGSKTVQIKFDQKVPTLEIKQILKAQAKMNEAKS